MMLADWMDGWVGGVRLCECDIKYTLEKLQNGNFVFVAAAAADKTFSIWYTIFAVNRISTQKNKIKLETEIKWNE